MKKYKSFTVTSVQVEPVMGSDIGSVTRDAIILATTEWRNVHFTFNGKKYIVEPNDLLASVFTNKENKR
jgi:hypothetical protein